MIGVHSLSIGRLHTRYVGVDNQVAGDLDVVLRDVVHGSLERAVQDFFDGSGRSPWAICIASVDVGIELDVQRSREAVASQWAHSLVEAVARAVESSDAVGDALVVYRTEQDALRDLVVGVATRRFVRHWAWQQLALVDIGTTPPTGTEVADALAARPAAAAAVIASCRADAWRVIDPIGWILIASAVARAGDLHLPARSSFDTSFQNDVAGRDEVAQRSPNDGDARSEPVDGERMDRPVATGLVERIVAAIPPAAWSAAEGAQSKALALLAATMVAPHAARRPEVLDAVVARAERGTTDSPKADALRRASARRPTPTPTAPSSTSDVPVETDDRNVAEQTHTSGFGGVWYLVRPITELDVMVRLARHDAATAPALLAAVVGRVTGVSPDDPAVALLTGIDGDRSPDDGDADDAVAADDMAIVVELADQLTEELAQRGDGRLAGRDLSELWRRPVEMTVGVGTIEVVFDLDDVDLDIRVLGFDVDPGFVWWSGSIVRFDYV